jgi:hypothetical protein
LKKQSHKKMKKIIILFVIGVFYLNTYSQNSNRFHNPLVWLRADNPGSQNGQWMDVSGNGYNAVTQNNQSLPDTGMFNYHPCFMFDSLSNPLNVNYKAKKEAKMLVLAVYKPAVTQQENGIWSLGLDSSIQVKLTTQRLKNVYKFIKYNDSTSTQPTLNLLSQNWRNKHIDSTMSRLIVGGTDSLNFTGKFAEFILYDTTISGNDILKVHTYLAIKYGVCIKDKNYIASNDSILWDSKKNLQYNQEIAGIGKDSLLYLNQKQSAGNGGDSPLRIAVGSLKITNDENTSQIQEGAFLIWGNNGQTLTDVNQDTLDTTRITNMSKSVWLMKNSGVSSRGISTQVVLNASEIYGAININLVINRYGNTTFPIDSSIVINPDSVDSEMNYYFSGIQWDTDSSGYDVFGFQVLKSASCNNKTNNNNSSNGNNGSNNSSISQNGIADNSSPIIDCSLFPNPTISNYTINIKLNQELPITVTIQGENGKKIEVLERKSSSEYTLKGYLKERGCYLVTIESGQDSKTYKLIVQ